MRSGSSQNGFAPRIGWRWWPDIFLRYARAVETGETYTPRSSRIAFKGTLCDFVEAEVVPAVEEQRAVVGVQGRWHSGAYLLETIPCVLQILALHGGDSEEALVRSVNDTKDNDTIAAVVGAAVGALHGEGALPARWRQGLTGRLVFAGDVVDRGPRIEECFDLLEELNATCLLRNHDVAVIVGYWIPGQDRESKAFQEKLRGLFLGAGDDGTDNRWEAVVCVEDVVISHAGVAGVHEDSVVAEKAGNGPVEPAALARRLNRLVRSALEEELEYLGGENET